MQSSRDMDKFLLRLPDGMRATLKVRAAENRRSMNAEILLLLERALQGGNDDGVKFGDRAPSSSQNQPVSAG